MRLCSGKAGGQVKKEGKVLGLQLHRMGGRGGAENGRWLRGTGDGNIQSPWMEKPLGMKTGGRRKSTSERPQKGQPKILHSRKKDACLRNSTTFDVCCSKGSQTKKLNEISKHAKK